jgi:DNA ligase (NAD+)
LVLKVNCLHAQGRVGSKNNRPEHSIAVKPTPKACTTKVLSLVWDAGLSGRFTPVAHVEPTHLDGVTLRKVNMHNLDYLGEWVAKGFGIGAEITVIRSGDVIPYLTQVITPANPV